jgi:glycerol uptake facilitator-like aquaporin
MFGVAPFEVATKARSESALWFAEAVATCSHSHFSHSHDVRGATLARRNGANLYIAAAYWFTASTSFANPAVTIARALTDTFTGIAPSSVRVHCRANEWRACGARAFGVALWPARHAGRTT